MTDFFLEVGDGRTKMSTFGFADLAEGFLIYLPLLDWPANLIKHSCVSPFGYHPRKGAGASADFFTSIVFANQGANP